MPRSTFSSSSDRPTLGSPPPNSPRRRTRKSFCRRLERCCCTTLAYFPLVFVYGLTTWAVWVEVNVSLLGAVAWFGYVKAVLGVALWALANGCYTTAVFTGPGSPVDALRDASLSKARRRGGGKAGGAAYEGLPTYEDDDGDDDEESAAGAGQQHDGRREGMTMVTAKSSGQPRYCKKCACTKPDRTHHCSTCGQCVLKMDHHCPWLATCVGLRNYKPFLLFLTYTSLFSCLCFAVSASWVWAEIIDDVQMDQGLMVVNTILLAVLGGIIGLVLGGFTGWHIYLACTGQTTIESLEKTRYLSPLRKSLEHQPQRHYVDGDGEAQQGEQTLGDQLKEIHANALPGVLRPEEGEESSRDPSRATTPTPSLQTSPAYQPSTSTSTPTTTTSSPARTSLHRNTLASQQEQEAQRERARYAAYLDEVDSEKLPNAFDMGWRRNLLHVFGDRPLLWFLPVCNTSGDGWQWAVSPRWVEAREEVARGRALAKQREEELARRDGHGYGQQRSGGALQPQPPPKRQEFLHWTPGQGFVDRSSRPAAPPSHHTAPSRGSSLKPHSRGNGDGDAAAAATDMQLQPLDRRKASTAAGGNAYAGNNAYPGNAHGGGGGHSSDATTTESYDTSSSSDEDVKRMYSHVDIQGHGGGGMGDWNDIPAEFLSSPRRSGNVNGAGGAQRNRSRGRRKGKGD
ncbi:hypothetical protein LTR36_001459 [Oleoguttula mirabilis]|uniref:Palmitoyltransferase n=1 Tax=Oleoguttula mirabilis TaxID=1507867 RepID=A0AAV9J386_9PEZI|nr:hypothetical protein LTR36_001459 [Oleoguttula mirabilis]